MHSSSVGWRNPKPIGPEQIVRGDKVMQTRNNSRAKRVPADQDSTTWRTARSALSSVSWGNKFGLPANVEFSSQIGATYTYWPSSGEDRPLELAWEFQAVTVHKSQGSEFKTAVLVLPKRVRVSRELLYTALTRQKKRIVILHDGSVEELVALAHPSNSEAARRLTDLFVASSPTVIEVDKIRQAFTMATLSMSQSTAKWYGARTRSSSRTSWRRWFLGNGGMKCCLKAMDGSWCRPDFTISRPSGVPVYWEHLGKMNQPSYARRWEEKLQWYRSNGILPALDPEGHPLSEIKEGPNGLLVWTDDAKGVDTPAWTEMARAVVEHKDLAGAEWSGTPRLPDEP